MRLVSFTSPFLSRSAKVGIACAIIACAALLSGCVQSPRPILDGGEQLFGSSARFQLYGISNGMARDPDTVSFRWSGDLYKHSGGGLKDVTAFSAHPFEGGDYIVQTVPAKREQAAEYALAHKLADGVWQVQAIDEADADEATRAKFCKNDSKYSCTVETREALFAFARATAARPHASGGLAIRLPDEREPGRRRQKQ